MLPGPAIALLLLTACEAAPPPLLQVFDAKPKQVEATDTLVIRGAGYPPGESGMLELEGVVHRAGSQSESGFRVTANIKTESDERATLDMTPELVQAFTRTDDGPRHATFRGTATLTFAPGIDGAPPIQGSGELVLDVYPAEAAESGDPETFYGAEFRPGAAGLEVTSLLPDGRLARGGLQVGDQLLEMDGLSAVGASDLEPRAGQRVARFKVLGPGALPSEPPIELGVDVSGYRPRGAGDLRWALSLLVPLALLLLASQSRWTHALSSFFAMVLRREDRDGSPWSRQPGERLPTGFVPFLGASAVYAGASLGLLPGLGDLGLGVVFALTACLELLAAFLLGGRAGRRWSLVRACWATLRHLPLQATLALAFLAIVLQRASLGLGPTGVGSALPWSSPSDLLACFVLLALAFSRAEPAFARTDFGSDLKRLSSLLLLGAVVSVFFGVSDAKGSALAATVTGQVEFTLAYVAWLGTQHALAKTRIGDANALVHRLLLPCALLGTALAPVWLAEVWPEWLRDSVRAGMAALVVASAAGVALLALTRLRVRENTHFTNPWL